MLEIFTKFAAIGFCLEADDEHQGIQRSALSSTTGIGCPAETYLLKNSLVIKKVQPHCNIDGVKK